MHVEAARQLAIHAHRDHVDRYGRPFIEHPMRVAASATEFGELLVMAGLLHDVVEKEGITWDQVREAGADDDLVAVLDAMTERPGESEHDYLSRVASDHRAVVLKRIDVLDKLSDEYSEGLGPEQLARIRHKARRRLLALELLVNGA